MRKLICLLVMVLLLCSCQSHIIDEEESPLKKSTTFSFVKIEFVLDENSYVKDIEVKYPEMIIDNNLSIEQTFIDDPQKTFKEYSNFWCSDARVYGYVGDQIFVKTPIDITTDDRFVYDDSTEWLYSPEQQRKAPMVESSRTLYIKPGYRLIIYPRFILKEVYTNYKLYLEGVEEGEERVFGGSWSGTKFLDYKPEYIEIPIPED